MGVTKRKQGGNNYPGAESLWGHQIPAGAPKSTNNVTNTFFTVLLLAKDFRLYHGGGKLASCPGRHLTSLLKLGPSLDRKAQPDLQLCVCKMASKICEEF